MIELESGFREIVIADFEFRQPDGERPTPVCVVAHELVSGRRHRLMLTDNPHTQSPYPTGADVLFVAFYASAELSCHLALGWDLPQYVLDLYAEFRNLTNGLDLPAGKGLLGALIYHGLDAMDSAEKGEMRELAMRGGPYTGAESESLLSYCESDVNALRQLLTAMLPRLDVPHAINRGRFMKAAARIERTGIPIDAKSLTVLQENWELIQSHLIESVDADYGVYEGRTFKTDRFAAYLNDHAIDWPRLESGRLALDDDTFRTMARVNPEIEPLRQLRGTLSQLHLRNLSVGSDDRNRCMLSAFAAKTGRNQPSNSKFAFGPAAWMRGLIQPKPGSGLAYVDYSQQEFGIAAALSGDKAMMDAYSSGDPYLEFAKQAGAAPSHATKSSHKAERDQFKACTLAVQYGMGQDTLALRIGQSVAQAGELLRLHRATYLDYWRWSEQVMDHAKLRMELQTVFGWTLHLNDQTKSRTVANFPMQGNGSEMLRLACCLATERGIGVCAPVHDALLIESPLEFLNEAVASTQDAMLEAGKVVLDGFELRSDAKLIISPKRYQDDKAGGMWNLIWSVVENLKAC